MSQLLEQVLNQVLHAQASKQLQVVPYERSEEQQGYRNGTHHIHSPPECGPSRCGFPACEMVNFPSNYYARYQRSEQA